MARENAAKPETLAKMGRLWVKLCKRLRDAGVAHADVQHGNVILVPGSRSGAYGLKLIDYDGMWIPALTNIPSGESGHPSYQHPARATTQAYSPDVDRFPHLVVATALKGLAVGGSALWEKYDTGDNLLFTEDDYRKPSESKLMRELWQTENPAVQALVGRLAVACGKPIPQTPWLDQLASDGEPAPLDDATRREAAQALGIARPVPVSLPPEPAFEVAEPAPTPVRPPTAPAAPRKAAPSTVDVELVKNPPAPKKKRAPKEPAKGPPVLLIGGALLLLVVGVIGGVLLSWGKSKPDETAQQKPDEPKNPASKGQGEVPKPKDKIADPVVPKPKDLPVVVPQPTPPGKPRLLAPRWVAPSKLSSGYKHLHIDDATGLILTATHNNDVVGLELTTGATRAGFAVPAKTRIEEFFRLDGGRVGVRIGGKAPELRVWDGATGREINTVPIPDILAVGPGLGTSAVLSPDGKYLVVARTRLPEKKEAAELPIHIFDTTTKKVLVKTDWKNNGTIHFTADSSRVLFADTSGQCHWVKLPTGERAGEWTFTNSGAGTTNARQHTVTSMSADGALLGYTGTDGTFRRGDLIRPAIIDGKTGKVLHEFLDGYGSNSQVALSADGTRAAVRRSTRDTGTYDVVDARSGAVLAHVATETGTSNGSSGATQFAFTRDGAVLVVLCYHSKSAYLFDVNRSGPVAVPGPKNPPPAQQPVVLKERWNVPADSEGSPATLEIRDQTIVWGSPRTSLASLDLQSGGKRPAFRLIELTGGDMFFAMDAGRVAKYVTDDKEFRTWDVKTGKTGEKIPVAQIAPGIGDAKLRRAWLSPDGRFHVVARAAPTLGAHAAVPFGIFETDKLDKNVAGVTWVGGSVHFTADSARVLVAEYGGGFSWFNLLSGKSEGWIYPAPPNGRSHKVTDVSADGMVIGYNGPARSETDTGPCLVDGKSGEVLHRFGKGFAETSPVALSADGRVAAVLREPVGAEVTVEVVGVPKGDAIARATVTTKGATPTFALSSDGHVLLVHDPKTGLLRRFDLP